MRKIAWLLLSVLIATLIVALPGAIGLSGDARLAFCLLGGFFGGWLVSAELRRTLR